MRKIFLFVVILFSFIFSSEVIVQAKISDKTAQKKYVKKLDTVFYNFEKENYHGKRPFLKYAFADIAGDETLEMIVIDTEDLFGNAKLYSFYNGKIKCVLDDFNYDIEFSKSKKYLGCTRHREGDNTELIYEWKNGKFVELGYEWIGPDDPSYFINGKAVSASEYSDFVKKKLGNETFFSSKDLKWYDYEGNPPVVSILKDFTKAGEVVVEAGSRIDLGDYSELNNGATVTVSKKKIAEIKVTSSGITIIGKKKGTTKVTVKKNGKKYSFKVKVIKKGSDKIIGFHGDENDNNIVILQSEKHIMHLCGCLG